MRGALGGLILHLLLAQSACAGAWLREPDTAFLSISATVRNLNGEWRSENSLYAEYGLAPRLTLGVDTNQVRGLAGHALVFARIPIGSPESRTRLALELALGAQHIDGQWGQMIKSTISAGKGFDSRWGNGWFNVDAAMEVRRPDLDRAFKLDATVGLSSGFRIRPILQIESTYIRDTPLIWSITPGVMIDGPNETTWLIGMERKTANQSSLGLKFGLWRSF